MDVRVEVPVQLVDVQGRPLAGVRVAIDSGEHPFPDIGMVSNYKGEFFLPPLLPGKYVLAIFIDRGRVLAPIQVYAETPLIITVPRPRA